MAHPFARYAEEVAARRRTLHAFRCYMADGWWYQGQGMYSTARFNDIVNPPKDFDAQGVVDSVIAKAGLEVR